MAMPAQVEKMTDRSVRITRCFRASRPMIWQAFTDPALLVQWLASPPGWDVAVCDIDLKSGGRYQWVWRDPKTGQQIGIVGTYRVVDPMRRLIDKQRLDQDGKVLPSHARTLNSVVFEDDGQGCRVSTLIRYPNAETRDMVMDQGLREGMEVSYRRLDHLLPQVAA